VWLDHPATQAKITTKSADATVDSGPTRPYCPAPLVIGDWPEGRIMRVASSLKTLKKRHKECRVVRRKGRVYVINKQNPRFKARQG